jgi:hypothetical protein
MIALIRRKPGTTREEFIEHYKNHYARLIGSCKHRWLADHSRNYVIPGSEVTKLDGAAGSLPDCDVVTIASFATEEDFRSFSEASKDPEFQQAVVADEETSMDRDSIRFFRVDAHLSDLAAFAAQ